MGPRSMSPRAQADDNALVEQAIARVLDAERTARISIAEAQAEALAIAERARASVRAIDERALKRIVAIRARFEARIAAEVDALNQAAAALDIDPALDDADRAAVAHAVAALAGELTGGRP
jgi:hypothetical protein